MFSATSRLTSHNEEPDAVMKRQKGYAQIEIYLAIALSAILGVGITAFTIQTITETKRSSVNMHEIQQLENAGYWVSRDVQMSQNITTGASAGFPLQLTWRDESNNTYEVTYNATGGQIQRILVENGGAPRQTLVAQLISTDPDLTTCDYTDGLLTFKVTTAAANGGLSRTYQIKKRPG